MDVTAAAEKIIAETAKLEAEARAAKNAAQRANMKLANSCKVRAVTSLNRIRDILRNALEAGAMPALSAELEARGFAMPGAGE